MGVIIGWIMLSIIIAVFLIIVIKISIELEAVGGLLLTTGVIIFICVSGYLINGGY